MSSKRLDEACASNTFINIYWCLAAFFLASASAFLKASHSSLGIWPRNWVCPVPTIAWLHTLQLYSLRGAFSELAGSSLADWSYTLFRWRHSVVRLTGCDWDICDDDCAGLTALPTLAWPTVSSLSGISSGVLGSGGAAVGRSRWAGSAPFARGYCVGNDFP